MDWFTAWEPEGYVEIERVDSPMDSGMLTAWLILAVMALAGFIAWYRQRVVHLTDASKPSAAASVSTASTRSALSGSTARPGPGLSPTRRARRMRPWPR